MTHGTVSVSYTHLGRVCVIGMSRYDYEELMREKVFIRDGKSVDSAGVINTTNTFVEDD